MSKLPNVFVNNNVGPVKNNQDLYYSSNKKEEPVKKDISFSDKLELKKKINNLFSSSKFVYKLPVKLTTNKGTSEETIVSKVGNNLVTIGGRYINIEEIQDIKEK